MGTIDQEKREALIEQINQEIEDAIDEAESAKYVEPEEAYQRRLFRGLPG